MSTPAPTTSGERPEHAFMRLAIEEMKKCQSTPKVGAVIVKDSQVVATGYRDNGVHAERVAIEAAQAAGIDLKGATLFTTLEPCVSLGSAKEPCASLIVRTGIKTVYIGRYDAHPNINRQGWHALGQAGILRKDFAMQLREEIDALNSTFTGHFQASIGPENGAKFDYQLHGGYFVIQYGPSDPRTIRTRWTLCGKGAIHAYAWTPEKVAYAKFAKDFDDIDDPRAFDFAHASVRIAVGEIAVFISDTGYALVKVLEVHSGPDYESDHTSVKIRYKAGAWDSK